MSDNFSKQIEGQNRFQSYNHKILTHAWNIASAMKLEMYFDSDTNRIVSVQTDAWNSPEKLNNLSSLCSRFDQQECLELKMSREFRAILITRCISDEDKELVEHFYTYSQDFLPRDEDELLIDVLNLLHKKPDLIQDFFKNAHRNLGCVTDKGFSQTVKLIADNFSPEEAIACLCDYLKKQDMSNLHVGFREKREREIIKVLEEYYPKQLEAGSFIFSQMSYVANYLKIKNNHQLSFEEPESPVISLTVNYEEIKYYLDFPYLIKEDIGEWIHMPLFDCWEKELTHTHKGLEKMSALYWGKTPTEKSAKKLEPTTEKVQVFLSIEKDYADCLTRQAFVKSLKSLLSFLKENQPQNRLEMNELTKQHQKAYWLNHILSHDLKEDDMNTNDDTLKNNSSGKFKI